MIGIIVIGYNLDMKTSPVYQTYKNLNKKVFHLYVADNSTETTFKEQNRYLPNVTYIDNDGNIGLSKAYNKVVREYESVCDAFIIFDQDTHVGQDYFECVIQSLDNSDALVLVPIVDAGSLRMSPLKYSESKINEPLEPIFYTKTDGVMFINSGSVIRTELFKKVGYYNESLFLDLVDYELAYRCYNQAIGVYIMDYTLDQEFSGSTYNGYEKDISRFRIYSKDFKIFIKSTRVKKRNYYVLWRRGLALTKHYKTIEPIKIILKKNKEER